MNMKFWNAGSGKAEDIIHAVKNGDTVVIKAGMTVVYAMNGTDDGLSVILPQNSTAAKVNAFTAGIAVHDIQVGQLENIQVYGFNRKTLVVRGTRAASTDAWPTMASIGVAEALTLNSLVNAMQPGGTIAAGNIQPFAVAAEQIAAGPTLAATNNGGNPGSATVYYQAIKSFLRFL